MSELVMIALAGFFAAMVDGALGMGFGPTSATILLSTGMSPVATSATVNIAKVATGLVAGVSHWRFNNIDKHLVRRLAVSGAGGAVIGTYILTTVDGDDLRPFLAILLLLVGARILFRFSVALPVAEATPGASNSGDTTFEVHGASIAGAAGGFTNGLVGSWGPVVTPFLLHRGLPPRYAVGTVNTAELAVAVVAAGSLLSSLGSDGIELGVVIAMLTGGVLAAPLAAYVVQFLPARILGLAVAALLLITQSRELASAGFLPLNRWIAYLIVLLAAACAALRPRVQMRRSKGVVVDQAPLQ